MVEVGGSNPPGPTKFLSLCFSSNLFICSLSPRVLWRVTSTLERYRSPFRFWLVVPTIDKVTAIQGRTQFGTQDNHNDTYQNMLN